MSQDPQPKRRCQPNRAVTVRAVHLAKPDLVQLRKAILQEIMEAVRKERENEQGKVAG